MRGHGRRPPRRGREGRAGCLPGRPAATGCDRCGAGPSSTGSLTVFVQVDGVPAGALAARRPDPPRRRRARSAQLRRDGIRRIVMVTGDRAETAQTVGAVIGVDEVLAERTPAEKVDAVGSSDRSGSTIMVGDGINDAPALALADVGVAIGARGATASSEAADVVLTVDRLDRLGEASCIARRSRRIALAERDRRHRPVAGRDGRRRVRIPPARAGARCSRSSSTSPSSSTRSARLRDTTSTTRLHGEDAALDPALQRRAHEPAPRRRRASAPSPTTLDPSPTGRVARDGRAADPPLPRRGARPARAGRGRDALPGRSPACSAAGTRPAR